MPIQSQVRHTRHESRARAASLIDTVATVILAGIVLICAALLAPAIWTTLVHSMDAGACASISDAHERAACIDAARKYEAAQPAKGAIAPLAKGDRTAR